MPHALPSALRFRRSIAAVGLIAIAAVSALPGWGLSRFLAECMLEHEARLTHEFVENIVLVENAGSLFTAGRVYANESHDVFLHLEKMPDVLRVNLYSRDRRIIWSTDPTLTGRPVGENGELDQALRGKLFVYGGERSKLEHAYLSARYRWFVETYSPIHDPASGAVIGVVEVYRAPHALTAAIDNAQRGAWLGAGLSALLLYAGFLTMWRVTRNSGGQGGSVSEGFQLRPGYLWVGAAAKPAIRAGHDVFPADAPREILDPLRD